MKNAKLNWVRLPLKGIENCRELGGYSTEFGQQTKWHSFLRSSHMTKLKQEEIAFLKEYGVKTVIDLRREDELERYKNPLAEEKDIDYVHIPFSTKSIADITRYRGGKQEEYTLGDFYIELLEEDGAIQEIFESMHQAKEGCVLFHCQVGKDRTGVVAMLLLALAGVEKKDIVANYEVTYTNMESMREKQEKYKGVPTKFLLSNRDFILQAYEYLHNNYQNIDHYFQAKGVTQEVIDGLKSRLIQEEYAKHGDVFNLKG